MSLKWMAFLLVLALAIHVSAQTPTATITGYIYDQSQAVVPEATITISSGATGFKQTTTSDDHGAYRLLNLPAGTYELRAEKAGFKTSVVPQVTLEVAQVATVDFTVQIGQVTQSVEVSAAAPLVETADSQVGTLVTEKDITDLPLNGRDFIQLNRLVPGVVAGPQGNFFDTDTTQNNSSFSVNGQRIFFNQFYVDGVNTTQSQSNGNSFSPPLDAIEEFKLQQSQYEADVGQGGAGQVNLITKSGTNELHGSLWEFVRNNIFDAENFFQLPGQAAPYRQNQFGGVVGGPVILPHIYNGKDRTFFFFSYEGFRVVQDQITTFLEPSPAEQQGNFTALLPNTVLVDPINPAMGIPFTTPTGAPCVANNVIATSCISSIAKGALVYYPTANSSNPLRNFVANSPSSEDNNYFDIRIDHRFSDNDTLMVRFQRQTKSFQPFVANPEFSQFGHNNADNPMGAYTHVFNSRLVNDLRVSYNDNGFGTITGHSFGPNIGQQLGILGLNTTVPRDFGVPTFNISGFQGLGDPATYEVPYKNFEIKDTLSWVHGKHAFKFGTDLQRRYFNFQEIVTGNGSFTFTGQFTGNSFADFLLGLPDAASRSITQFAPRYRQQWIHFFVQDDWSVTSRLTLNMGLRYEANLQPISANNTIATFDPATGTIVTPGQSGYPRSLKNGGQDWSPRFGLAYRLTQDGKTALRAGYGLYYQQSDTNEDVDLAINPPFILQNAVTSLSTIPTINFSNPFGVGSGATTSPVLVIGSPKNYPDPYIQQWDLDIQRSIPGDILVDVGYLGNEGTHLPMLNWINQPMPGPGAVQPRRPYPSFATIDWIEPVATSSYNALQIKSEKRFSRGLSFLVSYTFSKAIDTSSTAVIGTGTGQTSVQDAYNLRAERGLSLFDTKNLFLASWVWELPFGQGRAVSLTGPLNMIFGGWQVQGITTAHSGQPFGISLGQDRANVGDGTQRPNQVHDPNLPASAQTINRFFDPTAFTLPALFTFGNEARNNVIGPGFYDWDLGLEKVFRFNERSSLEFRTEFFNAFNHPNFFQPVANFSAANFGAITGANFARQIQFGLRLVY